MERLIHGSTEIDIHRDRASASCGRSLTASADKNKELETSRCSECPKIEGIELEASELGLL